jgi:PhoPQ-activated pathogenicity-related protein
MIRFNPLILLSLLVAFPAVGFAQDVADAADVMVPQGLARYVEREESVYKWELRSRRKLEKGTIYDMDVTSQTWQGIVWKHPVTICEPNRIRYSKHALLFVTGGSKGRRPSDDDLEIGLSLATLCGARVVTVHQVPNQPLFDGRYEDDLITETWLKYLQTGDETWPLLFPMVKSAVKTMDAIQEFAKSEWEDEIEGFVITGASKRGWTSWLTPVVDERVVATAPIVIDVLNFRPQMKHQLKTWGKYSVQIKDYSSKGLIVEGKESPREAHLRHMMDPYTYRRQLKLPKLLVNGTNDPYWVVDAMSVYWDDLVGPKYVLQVPNAGHGLDGGLELALSTVAAFFQHQASGTPLPQVSWEIEGEEHGAQLKLQTSQKPLSVRFWSAKSETQDFRKSEWTSQAMRGDGAEFINSVSWPESGHLAYYGEAQFHINGVPYSLCTVMQRDHPK